ncbi:serine protease [Anaeramoeba flamelloides]|uniref:Serine protease n=1 Tax=Anaeramoeba flamelloides TaxID=1746091 RepID=A0AAV7YTP9_9EUKA|nr:serine protease [Anaeramoeba flamelloides]
MKQLAIYFFLLILLSSCVCLPQHRTFHSFSPDGKTINNNNNTNNQENENEKLSDKYFEQLIDHLTPETSPTFNQRYFVNDTFYESGSPVFLFLGGEGELTSRWVRSGMIVDLAKEFGALLVGLEHRYYGKSQPFTKFSVENLQYLSSNQALHDVANLKSKINETYTTSAWISFGCSYSGALSLWLRQKFPHIIDGAYSGSSPVLAKLNYLEYDSTCEQSVGYSCLNYLQRAFLQIKKLMQSSDGYKQLSEMFNTCKPITTEQEKLLFKYSVVDLIAYSTQYNLNILGFPRDKLCSNLASAQDKLAEYVKMSNALAGNKCLSLNLDDLKSTDTSPSNNMRPWWWQKATEFGYYKNTPQASETFFPEIDSDFHNWIANQTFGHNISPNVDFTNLFYGGKNPDVSNVIISNGKYDPWSKLSILQSKNQIISDVYVSSGHCAPLYSIIKDGEKKTPEDVIMTIDNIRDFCKKIIQMNTK